MDANKTIADLQNYFEDNKEKLEKKEKQSDMEELRSELEKLKTLMAKSASTMNTPKETTVWILEIMSTQRFSIMEVKEAI